MGARRLEDEEGDPSGFFPSLERTVGLHNPKLDLLMRTEAIIPPRRVP
jgi:hypothetical protein